MELLIAAGIGLVILFILYRIFRAFLKWALILIIGLAVVAYVTNPDEAKHRQAVKDNTRNLKRKVKEKQVEIKDYKIFSVTKITVKGEEKTVGVGAFGRIWYFGDIEEKINDNIRI
jgi:hypothetical protein